MNKRPLSVTIVGCLFAAVGLFGLAYHAMEVRDHAPFRYDVALVLFVRLLAVLAGILVLRGSSKARWLLVAWLAYHVVLSALHSVFQAVVHVLLLAVFAYLLFRPKAAAYFRRSSDPPPP